AREPALQDRPTLLLRLRSAKRQDPRRPAIRGQELNQRQRSKNRVDRAPVERVARRPRVGPEDSDEEGAGHPWLPFDRTDATSAFCSSIHLSMSRTRKRHELPTLNPGSFPS